MQKQQVTTRNKSNEKEQEQLKSKESNETVAAITGKEATTRAKRSAESLVIASSHGKEKT